MVGYFNGMYFWRKREQKKQCLNKKCKSVVPTEKRTRNNDNEYNKMNFS